MQVPGSSSSGNASPSPPPGAVPPLLLHLGSALTPPCLRRARFYTNLLANPPPPPHPFGAFLEEAERLMTAAAAETLHSRARHADSDDGLAGAGTERIEPPSLLELLRREHGHSAGNAMHRMWVQYPQECLADTAQRIADLVLTRAMPLVTGERKGDDAAFIHSESAIKREETPVAKDQRNLYDIHVRFLPSTDPRTAANALVSKIFCAEIIVRDVEALRRIDEEAELLRERHTSVAAEGQTVQSALAFWRAVAMESTVEENDGPLAGNVPSAVVLGRRDNSVCTGGDVPASAAWVQPPTRRQRYAAEKSVNSARRASNAEQPRLPLQSTAGLLAVFYLSFSGALYTGALCEEGDKEGEQEQMASLLRRADANTNSGQTERRMEVTAPPQDPEPVFFLPCAANTSFLRGLLGL